VPCAAPTANAVKVPLVTSAAKSFEGVTNSNVSAPAFAIFCPTSNSLNGISVKALVVS